MWMAKQGVCQVHYHRLMQNGTTEISRNPPGAGSLQGGYLCFVEDYERTFDHRQVAAKKLGRELLPTEVVHHKDENKLNNDPDNLEVCSSQSEHISKFHGGQSK
jgi:hypothetical protein